MQGENFCFDLWGALISANNSSNQRSTAFEGAVPGECRGSSSPRRALVTGTAKYARACILPFRLAPSGPRVFHPHNPAGPIKWQHFQGPNCQNSASGRPPPLTGLTSGSVTHHQWHTARALSESAAHIRLQSILYVTGWLHLS